MAQQTAMQQLIEWLEVGWKDEDSQTIIKKANQLLQIEKEQIKDAYWNGTMHISKEEALSDAEKFYNEYYKN